MLFWPTFCDLLSDLPRARVYGGVENSSPGAILRPVPRVFLAIQGPNRVVRALSVGPATYLCCNFTLVSYSCASLNGAAAPFLQRTCTYAANEAPVYAPTGRLLRRNEGETITISWCTHPPVGCSGETFTIKLTMN